MSHTPFRAFTLLLLAAALWAAVLPAGAQNEKKQYAARNGAFTFKAPAAFRDIVNAPKNALVALEVPGHGVSFMAQREKAEEVETDLALAQAKKNFSQGGATILGSARAKLASAPAFSVLVGGVKPGRESLFVYNLRSDYWYVFVLNYPEGQRKDAAELWQDIAPSITFKT